MSIAPGAGPRVTVVVTCFNYGHFLPQAVTSVLDQRGVNAEVLIVDDASTDDSLRVAEGLAAADPRVRVLSLENNLGLIGAVNRGMAEVRTEYVVKLDADDMLAPGSLARSVELLDGNRNVGFVYGRPRHFTGDRPRLRRAGRQNSLVWPGRQWFELRFQRGVNCISQPEAVIRTSALRAVGPYNPALPHTSDLEMWLRLAAVADVGRINGVDQGYYRVHSGSMQRTVNAGIITDLQGRREAFLSSLSTSGLSAAERTRLETILRRRLAAEALEESCRAYDRGRSGDLPVDDLVGFATSTYPNARLLPEFRCLEAHRRRPSPPSPWSPRSFSSAAARRGRLEWSRFRWMRTGV